MTNTGDQMAKAMSRSGSGSPVLEPEQADHPRRGDHYRCDTCGMQIEVKSDCGCHDEAEHFRCCGRPMNKV
jgi:hypothetical protein